MANIKHTPLKIVGTVIAVLLWVAHLFTGKPSLTSFLGVLAIVAFVICIFDAPKPPPGEDE